VKFSIEWLSDYLDVAAAGGADGARRCLDQAGIPVESVSTAGEDVVLDAEITPNRPDAMGHRGLAREIAAMSGQPMRDPAARYAEPATHGDARSFVRHSSRSTSSMCCPSSPYSSDSTSPSDNLAFPASVIRVTVNMSDDNISAAPRYPA